uniref:Uncharacterized protein n=1 Tax=Arundo donax TaxID=35708 RepID=A0A0A9BT85_ARUDO
MSLMLKDGCRNSSLAAMRAPHPSATLFRYTIGVLPISWEAESLILSPGKMAGSAAACCCWVEKSEELPAPAPASEMGAAPCWRSDLLRISLITILSNLVPLTFFSADWRSEGGLRRGYE